MPVTGMGPQCIRCRRRPVSEHAHCIPCTITLAAGGRTAAAAEAEWFAAWLDLPAVPHPPTRTGDA